MEAILNAPVKVYGNRIVLKGNEKRPINGSIIKNNDVTIPAGIAGYNAYIDSFPVVIGQLEIVAKIEFVIRPVINTTAVIIIMVAYEKKLPNSEL